MSDARNSKCYCVDCVTFGFSSHPAEDNVTSCSECGGMYNIHGKCACDDTAVCSECENQDCVCDLDEMPDDWFDEQVEAQKTEDARIKEKWKVLDEIIAGSKRKVTFHVDFKAKKVIKREEG